MIGVANEDEVDRNARTEGYFGGVRVGERACEEKMVKRRWAQASVIDDGGCYEARSVSVQ